MKVKIRTWESIEKEFWVDSVGDIDDPTAFTVDMEAAMPKDRIITISNETDENGDRIWITDGGAQWFISTRFIEEILED